MRKVKLWLALMAILVATVAGAQSTITVTAAEYFFDTDPGYGKATVINNAVEGEQTLDIPTSTLSVGAHILCMRSLGSNGVWSSTMTKPIYVMHTGNNTYSVEYFFDNDPGYGKGNVLIIAGSQDVTIDIDTKDVTPGAHMLYLRSQDTNGNWSSVMAHPLYVFTILPVAALEYYIDNNDPGEGLAISVPVATATAAAATFDIDTSELTPGEHTLNIRAMGIDSVWTAISSRTFTIEGPAEPEPYAAFSDDNTVLTFYYDTKKEERSGMGVGPFSPSISGSWGNKTSSITTVVFDESFASYTSLTSTSYWFSQCKKLTTIVGMENLNTSGVTKMDNMFLNCEALTSLDLSSLNTSEVTRMDGMIRGCTSLLEVNLSNFNTEKVESTNSMFYGCNSLKTIDLSSFATPKLSNTGYMFFDCTELTTIYASEEWTVEKVTESSLMFSYCNKLVGGMGTVFSNDYTGKQYARIDGGPSNPGYFTDKNAPAEPEHYAVLTDNGIVINPEGAALPGKTLTFYYDTEKQARGGMSVGPFDLPQNREWESLEENITTVEFDTSMANDTTITSTAYWFYGCLNLEYVYGIENLKTPNVTDMKYMFYGCNVLQEVELSGFNTANVTDMSGMFYKCHSLQTIDLTNFNTAKVTNMSWMFYNCTGVTKIYAGSYWTTASVTESEEMFVNCTQVVGSAGTTYDANHVDAAYAHIDGGPSNPGYLSDKNAPVITEPEPYAVLADNTLTFYYDTKKAERNGMSVGPFSEANQREWNTDEIKTVVFDDSFAQDTTITSTAYWFDGCVNLTTVEGIQNLNTQHVTDMRSMFSVCYSLTSLDVSHFNTANVTNMGYMFYYCGSLTSIDVSNFNTANVTTMGGMFASCTSLTTLDVSGFKTDNVTDMSNMFSGCSGLTSLDITNFNTANVTDMSEMFYRCGGLTSLDLSGFNTANVTNMYNMFYGCYGLTSLDVSHFNTANVTNMESMFAECSGFKILNLSSFNTAKVEYTQNMFRDCAELTTIFAGDEWTMAAVTWGPGMFSNCYKLVGGKGTTYDADHIDETYAHIDEGTANPGYFTRSGDDPYVAPAETVPYAVLADNTLTFYYDTKKAERNGMSVGPFSEANQREWNTDEIKTVVFDDSFAQDTTITSTAYWLEGCVALTSVEGIQNLNTQHVTDMQNMFWSCGALTTLDVSNFNTANVTNMNGMFYFCGSLTNLDVSHFNTAKVTNMELMFGDCSGLTSLDLSHFSTESVTDMSDMFYRCSGLTTLDLSSFKTDNLMDAHNMFQGCSSLISLDMRGFNTSHVTSIENIFSGCSSLAAIQAGNANIPAEEYAQIQNPNLLVYVNEPSLAPQGVQNVVVNGVAQEIVLTDVESGNNNFFVPQSFTAGKVSYTRNFTQQTQPNVSRGWESISLPFNVQNIVHETKGALSPFGSSAEGKKFWLRRLADNGLTRVTQIVANVPYVISMPNSTEYTDLYNLSGRVTFSSENTTIPATTPAVLALADSSIVMMPTTLRVNRSSSVWAINVGEVRGQYLEGSVFERDYREVRPFEAYTVHRSNSPAPRFVPISEIGGTTGIEEVGSQMADGGSDVWYDLNGRRLQQKPTQKGVYILNGKKTVVE